MNLHIPQVQIGPGAVLGILGEVGYSSGPAATDVQFILCLTRSEEDSGFFEEQIEKELGVEVSFTFPIYRKQNTYPVILLFTLRVEGALRNPQGFLKAIARKVAKVESERLAQEAMEAGDTEEWCKLMGAKKSPLNQWP